MALYRISFELQSSLVTALKGDTIWGHFVWGIANHEGDSAVEKFLNESKTKAPPLIVSSAFPQGMICLPIPEPTIRKKTMSKADYSQIKKEKKFKYISAENFFVDSENSDNSTSIFTQVTTMHNTINRVSNTVEKGNLFAVKEYWTVKNAVFDLYILSTYDKERVVELSKWAFENGYGADASIGKGVVKVLEDSIKEITCKNKGNRYIALAPFVENSRIIKNLRSDIYVRNGRIGGTFATSMSPFKKTVILYDEGAVFECEEPISFIGELITDIHSDSRICQSGFAPVIPLGSKE